MARAVHFGLSCALLLGACGSSDTEGATRGAGTTFTRAQLLDPKTCKSCHPVQYEEWSSSMHAYAADDPVFIAMNKRGQRETNNELGDFCVRCHAPMAVVEGATDNGLNAADLPFELKGVTCYFCHNVTGITESHNGLLELANDTTMRGSFRGSKESPPPVANVAHRSSYSKLFDRDQPESSQLCGSCHDVVTPKGVHIERTLKEYDATIFTQSGGGRFQTCQNCHMKVRELGKAAVSTGALPDRKTYEHLWPGVDVPLGDFPHRAAQIKAVQCALKDSAKVMNLSLLSPLGDFRVEVETEAGHAQPSGAAHDRRMWLEFVAYDESDTIVYQSGMVADDQPERPSEPVSDARIDPTPWSFRDYILDADDHEVHFFWEAEKTASDPLLLKPLAQANVAHTVSRTFRVPSGVPARVTVRMRIRPIGFDIMQELVRSGDLDEKYLTEMPTFTLDGTVVEWKRSDNYKVLTDPEPTSLRCPYDYRCLLETDDAEACSDAE